MPGSARTLLRTPRNPPKIHTIPPGHYLHFGLEQELRILIRKSFPKTIPRSVDIDLFTDGGRLDKKKQVYPILVRLANVKPKSPIGIVGVYAGRKSPSNFQEFLIPLIKDGRQIKENSGIIIRNTKVFIRFRSFLGDALVRADLLNHKRPGSEKPCSRCKVNGVYYISKNRKEERKFLVYPGSSHPPRTLQEYYERADEFHYFPESPLVDQILDNPPLDVPLDYMHLILLGTMLRLMNVWLTGEYNRHERLSRVNTRIAMRRFSILSEFIPEEYARKPNELLTFKTFKATEFRQVLLVTGIIVFRGLLRDYAYVNFLFLHSAIRCLCYYSESEIHLNFAEQALKTFVDEVEQIYTKAFMAYNVHSLPHTVDDVRRHGSLDSISCFAFENVMGLFAKLLGKPALPLQQIYNRIMEIQKNLDIEEIIESELPYGSKGHTREKFSFECTQFDKLKTDTYTYRTECPNNVVFIDNQVHVIRNILQRDGLYFVRVRRFRRKKPFYDVGISSDQLGVFLVSDLSENSQLHPIESISNKCFMVPYSTVYDRNEPTCVDSSDDESSYEEHENSHIVVLM